MEQSSNLKILALVEATTVNAVARNVLDFHRTTEELRENNPTFGSVALSILTFNRQSQAESENEFITLARKRGISVHVISERGRFDRRIIAALRKIVYDEQPHLVVTHAVKSHFAMFRSGLRRDFPWIAYHHGYTTTDLKMRFYNLFDRRSLPKAEHVVTVCEAFRNELTSRKGVAADKISVLHNSIRAQPRPHESEVLALRAKHAIDADDRVIVSVGRLSQEKAQADLIRAFAKLRQSTPDLKAKLLIVGDGPERARLEAEAKTTGTAGSITFVGHVRDVSTYYAVADVLANASHSEGSPYVLLEAMAAGIPIVATEVGGVREMLTDGETALLIPPQNPAAMAQALARILRDTSHAAVLARKAKAEAAVRFSPETYVQNLLKIYRDVVAAHRKQTG
jgi:glycosyltransferase involved in cell wall biosynthesis